MKEYELIVLFHPRLDEAGLASLTEWVQNRITGAGGEVGQVTPWGRRTLAFPINKQREATYVQFDLKLDGGRINELTRALQLNEDVLRQLAVRKGE